MTSAEAYKLFLLKINRNDTNADIHISKAEFVKLFNEEQRRWLNEKLGVKLDTDEVNDLNELLQPFTRLEEDSQRKHSIYTGFLLPDDFFAVGTYHIIARRGSCKKVLEPQWVNMKNVASLLKDQFTKPSFDYERVLVTLAESKLQAYTDGFNIEACYLSYFKMPPDIDMAGYITEEGKASTSIDPVLQDMWTEQIINRCARAVIANYENPEGFQLREAIIKTEE